MNTTLSSASTLAQLRAGTLPASARINLTGLSLNDAELQALWPALQAHAPSLEILDIGHNQLTTLPTWLAQLPQLRVLFASFNPISSLPPVLAQCAQLHTAGFRGCALAGFSASCLPPQLRALILTDNQLTALPHDLGLRCPQLQKLMLSCNQLQHLPASLAHCQHLELLRLASNQLHSVPDVVLQLPALAWLALAGNPLSQRAEAQALAGSALPQLHWGDFILQRLLGEGTSGHIWQAEHGARSRTLAIKVFKNAHTSDGLPHSEMAAGIAAAGHAQLLTPEALVLHHPEHRLAMALPLLPAHWQALAGPPSLASCTRDVYAPRAHWSAATAQQLLQCAENALAHLHARHVLHGDLYAHNLLWDGHSGQACLSDFGAACLLHELPRATAQALLAIEQRALQHLRAEVLARVQPPAAAMEAAASTGSLQLKLPQPSGA